MYQTCERGRDVWAMVRTLSNVRVLHWDGTFQGNAGMRVAFAAAVQGDCDYYLGLIEDDDVHQYVFVRHPVRPPLRWTPYRTVGGFGATLFVAHVLFNVGNNLCTFFVGRSGGAAVVGQANRPSCLAFQWIRIHLGEVLANVLFSSLSAIQGGDKSRVRRVHLSVLCLGAVVLFPPLCWHGGGRPRAGPRCAGTVVAACRRYPSVVRARCGNECPFPFLTGAG